MQVKFYFDEAENKYCLFFAEASEQDVLRPYRVDGGELILEEPLEKNSMVPATIRLSPEQFNSLIYAIKKGF